MLRSYGEAYKLYKGHVPYVTYNSFARALADAYVIIFTKYISIFAIFL